MILSSPTHKNKINVRIKFYGPLKDYFNPEIKMALPEIATVLTIRDLLILENKLSEPILIASRAVIMDEFIELSRNVEEGDEIYFLPPASGG